MDTFEKGRKVLIPVHLGNAPFPDQFLVMIRFEGGNVSGLLGRSEVVGVEGSRGFVRGEVRAVKDGAVVLAVAKGLSGGMFTRAGVAGLPLPWARDNLLPDDGG